MEKYDWGININQGSEKPTVKKSFEDFKLLYRYMTERFLLTKSIIFKALIFEQLCLQKYLLLSGGLSDVFTSTFFC